MIEYLLEVIALIPNLFCLENDAKKHRARAESERFPDFFIAVRKRVGEDTINQDALPLDVALHDDNLSAGRSVS